MPNFNFIDLTGRPFGGGIAGFLDILAENNPELAAALKQRLARHQERK